MQDYRKILAPTDFSESATLAVLTAAELARRFDAELHILHIVSPQMIYAEMPEMMLPPLEDLTAELCSAGKRRLKELADKLGPGPTTHTHLEESVERPARAICTFADQLPADLLVIGSHGHTGLMHMLLGATAEHVVRQAGCPVLVTKPEPAQK